MRRCLAALVLVLLPTPAPAENVPLPRSRPEMPQERIDHAHSVTAGNSSMVAAARNERSEQWRGDEDLVAPIVGSLMRQYAKASASERRDLREQLQRHGWCENAGTWKPTWAPCADIQQPVATASAGQISLADVAKTFGGMLRFRHYNCPAVWAFMPPSTSHYGTRYLVACSNRLSYEIDIGEGRFFALPYYRHGGDTFSLMKKYAAWRHPEMIAQQKADDEAYVRHCKENHVRRFGALAALREPSCKPL